MEGISTIIIGMTQQDVFETDPYNPDIVVRQAILDCPSLTSPTALLPLLGDIPRIRLVEIGAEADPATVDAGHGVEDFF